MTDMKSEIIVSLTTPIQYSADGGFKDANELILKAPSNKHRRQANELKQGFFQALKGSADTSGKVETTVDDAGDHETTGDEIITAIMMSKVDYGKYVETFRELLLNDVCYITDAVKLTNPLFEKLSLEDTDTLLGEYLTNFLLASQLRKLKGK